jgi:hypothetical protein
MLCDIVLERLNLFDKYWAENLKGRGHLGSLCGWESNIKMDLQGIRREHDNLMLLAEDNFQ